MYSTILLAFTATVSAVYNSCNAKQLPAQPCPTETVIVLNPKDCLSCFASLRSINFTNLSPCRTIVLPEAAKIDGIYILKKAFDTIPKAVIVFSDSLYNRYSPDNNSYIVFRKQNITTKKIAIKAISDGSTINDVYQSAKDIEFRPQARLKAPNTATWSSGSVLGLGKQELYIMDRQANTVSSISLTYVDKANTSTALPDVTTKKLWSPTQLSYKQWYQYFFQDTTGLAKSLLLSPVLKNIGRQHPHIVGFSCSPNRDEASAVIQWAYAAPDGPIGKDVGVRLKSLVVELNQGVVKTVYAKHSSADSAGYSPSVAQLFWNSDSTLIAPLQPDLKRLASYQVLNRPVLAELAVRKNRVYWKRSINTVQWPTPQLRGQKAIGDYAVLIPDFFASESYIFYQAANEIYNINNGKKYKLSSYSDSKNDFDIRSNNKINLEYEVKTVATLANNNIVSIIRQGTVFHAIITDKYLTVMTDITLPSDCNKSQSWVIHPAGYVLRFDPATGILGRLALN